MKPPRQHEDAVRIIQRISELRDLCRALAQAGYAAGLHTRNPNAVPGAPPTVAESHPSYGHPRGSR